MKISLRHYICTLLCIGFFTCSFAQDTEKRFLDNVRFGGSVNLGFGNDYFTGGIAPSAVYDFNRYFSVGVGPSFSYTSAGNFNALTLGFSESLLFRPYQGLRLSVDFEQYYVDLNQDLQDGTKFERTYTYPAIFLGVGYTTGNITAGLRYDILYDRDDSIYGNALVPFVAVYF